jgi:phenylacetate-CoA ligase
MISARRGLRAGIGIARPVRPACRCASSAPIRRINLCQQYRFRQMWGLDLFDRSAFLGAGVPRAAAGLGGALDRMRQSATDAFRNRLRIDVHDLSPVALRRELHRIERFRPAYLYGYSRAIHLLALEALAQSFRCPSLRVVMLTSEPAFPHMIATVESAFRVPAVIEYGSVECGVIAYEWPDRKLRVRSDHVLVETLLRDDGRFDIVTTVLDNPDFPLFRYRIEDVTNAPLDLVDAAFPLLGNIAGRNDDVLFASDGSPVHPAEIDGVFEWASRPIVRRYRVHQNADGSIIVRIEPADTAKIDPAAIAQAIENKLRGRSVRVEIVDALEQTAAGKHRLITSDLQDGRWPAGAD